MMAPSTGDSLSMVVMNIAGVEANSQSKAFAPLAFNPSMTASLTCVLERRGSCPTLTLMCCLLLRFESHATKHRPRMPATSLVRLTSSPSTPASATPRMSEPFWSFFQSVILPKVFNFVTLYYGCEDTTSFWIAQTIWAVFSFLLVVPANILHSVGRQPFL